MLGLGQRSVAQTISVPLGTVSVAGGRTDLSICENAEMWRPLYHIFPWSDSESKDRMTLKVLMPTGVLENYNYGIINEGKYLELTIEWPRPFYEIRTLFGPIEHTLGGPGPRAQKLYQDHTLKVAAMKKQMALIINRKDNRLVSRTQIPLPRPASGETSAHLIAGVQKSLILVVDLYVHEKDSLGIKLGSGTLIGNV